MPLFTRRFVLTAVGAAALALTGLNTHAQSWPDKPIRLVVPYPAGGPTDVIARMLAQRLRDDLGQPVVVENKAGGGGTIGVNHVIRSPADGYTFALAAPGPLAGMPNLMKVPYEQDEIQYISLVARIPAVVVVNAASEFRTLDDFVRKAKAAPGTLNYSSAGAGTTPHIGSELLKQEADMDIVHVPYKGAAPAIVALLGGEVHSAMVDLLPVLPHVSGGKLRVLAVAGPQRAPQLPDVPTTRELGLPGVVMDTHYGVIAPRGLPADVQERFRAAVARAMQSPEISDDLLRRGAVAVSSTADEYRELMQAEYVKWGAVIAKGNIKLE